MAVLVAFYPARRGQKLVATIFRRSRGTRPSLTSPSWWPTRSSRQRQSAVMVSGFSDPFDREKAAGPDILAKLGEFLKENGIDVKSKADLR